MRKCFEYASPSNKAVTGPVERFGMMIRMAYPSMVHWESYEITDVEESSWDRYAVMGQCAAFRVHLLPMMETFGWVVSKQDDGCWMTDSVIPMDDGW